MGAPLAPNEAISRRVYAITQVIFDGVDAARALDDDAATMHFLPKGSVEATRFRRGGGCFEKETGSVTRSFWLS